MRHVLLMLLLAFAPPAFADEPAARERAVTASIDIEAPVAEAWDMWTTAEGLSFFAPAANIEIRPGGPYEVYFLPDAEPGMRGSEGTVVLGYQHARMLSITWALPPYMEEVRPHLTHLIIRFDPLGETRTRVSIEHDGWGEGEAWDAAYVYFERVWPAVLERMQTAAEAPAQD